MTQTLSVSRRTDIPAFYAGWFVNRLKAGAVPVRHPYSKKLVRISLRPEDVSAVVFWSKNYTPLLSRLERIEKTVKNLFFHFTITANESLSPIRPTIGMQYKDSVFLARKYSAGQVLRRFDPICITDRPSFEVHEERLMRCPELMKGCAKECIISFVHPYRSVHSSLKRCSIPVFLSSGKQA